MSSISPRQNVTIFQAIYLDTSILVKSFNTGSIDAFARLADLATRFKTGFYAPEVAVRELLQVRVDMLKRESEKIDVSSRVVERFLGLRLAHAELPPNVEDVAGQAMRRELKDAGIIEIATPELDLSALIEKAVKHIPPFRKGGHGFKDAVIASTILSHMSVNRWTNTLLVADDGDFASPAMIQDFRLQGVCVARSIPEACSELGAANRWLDEEVVKLANEELTQYVMQRWSEQVLPFVKANGRISSGLLKYELGEMESRRPDLTTIKKVISWEPKTVDLVRHGWFLSPGKASEGRIAITFWVRIDVTLLVEHRWMSSDDFVPLSEMDQIEKHESVSWSLKEETKTASSMVIVEASVVSREGKYSDLKMERTF